MWQAIVVAIVVAGVATFVLLKLRYYSRMFSESHFREFHGSLAAAIHAAMQDPGATQDPGADQRTPRFVTRAGLTVAVTFSSLSEGRYTLYISLSQPGQVPTHAVGRHFGTFIVAMLQGNKAELTPYFTDSGVRHLPFQLAAPTVTVQDFDASNAAYREFIHEDKALEFEYLTMETEEAIATGTAPPDRTS
jgi:hypothetical protein